MAPAACDDTHPSGQERPKALRSWGTPQREPLVLDLDTLSWCMGIARGRGDDAHARPLSPLSLPRRSVVLIARPGPALHGHAACAHPCQASDDAAPSPPRRANARVVVVASLSLLPLADSRARL